MSNKPNEAESLPEGPISVEDIASAEQISGLQFTDDERNLMLKKVNGLLESYQKLREINLDNGVPPALFFDPRLHQIDILSPGQRSPLKLSPVPPLTAPDNLEDLAFYPITHLAPLIRSRQVSSVALTEMYLARLKRYGPTLECVVTLTEELALAQAKRADTEIAAGNYRGPLHGIPWGAKDLLATTDIPTTWGAKPYADQMIDLNATVVERLTAAGAVLVAKLSLGALASGNVWFGGETKSPWNLEERSGGSSAGSGAATAAGLVGFAIGTETYGSIVSPSTSCGITGLRPTFGRVSRYGAMALSWSMDKIGPMCRSVEDCAIVFQSIYGPDGHDPSIVNRPFVWDPEIDLANLNIGYLQADFAEERDTKANDDQALATLESLGAKLIPIALPDLPVEAMEFLLIVEAAAAFDELTRSNRDDLLVRQTPGAWPNTFRSARTIPAVEYVQANRVRTLLIQEMARLMADIDLYVAPSQQGDNLLLTNLSGHPAVVLPNGFAENGLKTSITFIGQLDDEARLLAAARLYQEATDFHQKQPPLDF